MYEDIPWAVMNITRGSLYTNQLLSLADTTGAPLRGETDDWQAQLTIRTTYGSALIATLTTAEGGDGTLAIDDWGTMTATIPADATAVLPLTADSESAAAKVHTGDVVIWNADNPDPQRVARVRVRVLPEVTVL